MSRTFHRMTALPSGFVLLLTWLAGCVEPVPSGDAQTSTSGSLRPRGSPAVVSPLADREGTADDAVRVLDVPMPRPPVEAWRAAEAGVERFLERVPRGSEHFYGFHDRAEFARVSLGEPYLMMAVVRRDDTGGASRTPVETKPLDEWRFPVSVDGSLRCLLTVANMPDGWRAVGIGAAPLAAELQSVEDSLRVEPGRVARAILRDHVRHDHYVLMREAGRPVEATRAFLVDPLRRAASRGSVGAAPTPLALDDLLVRLHAPTEPGTPPREALRGGRGLVRPGVPSRRGGRR